MKAKLDLDSLDPDAKAYVLALVAIARAADAFAQHQGSLARGDFAAPEFDDLVLALDKAGL